MNGARESADWHVFLSLRSETHRLDSTNVMTRTIHFICTGNIYRSRLAEAYCASYCALGHMAHIRVLSSGIAAGRDRSDLISPYAAEVLSRYGLGSYAAPGWQRTTASLVQSSDVLVFMEAEHHSFCREWIEPARQRIEVWGIEDIGSLEPAKIPEEVERTFARIRQRTDALLADLGLMGEVARNKRDAQ